MTRGCPAPVTVLAVPVALAGERGQPSQALSTTPRSPLFPDTEADLSSFLSLLSPVSFGWGSLVAVAQPRFWTDVGPSSGSFQERDISFLLLCDYGSGQTTYLTALPPLVSLTERLLQSQRSPCKYSGLCPLIV